MSRPSWVRLAVVAGAVGIAGASAGIALAVRKTARADAAPAPTVGSDEAAAAEEEEEPASAPSVARPSEPRPYNVLLVTIDTLRADLGFSGYPRPVTPNLDKLAARAAVFERAYATASYTPKSVGPMLIGKYASETFRDGEHYTTFYGANVFLAERVKDAGYGTIGVMAHHYFKWKTGLDQGFDVWDTSAAPPTANDNDPSITSDKLTDATMAQLADPPPRFFAWVHYIDPHLPYVPHEGAPDLVAAAPDAAPSARALYDQEVWFTDREVGRLVDWVTEQPWGPDTAIVVTADHGEAFGEHGGYTRHGRELWEPVVRVPLLVYVPDASPRRVPVKRSLIDLVPTIVELLGMPAAPEAEIRGKSLVADVTAPPGAELEERDVYMDMPKGPFNELRRAFITDASPGMKLIDFGDGRYELYDLDADPLETKSLHGDGKVLRPYVERFLRFRKDLREVEAVP